MQTMNAAIKVLIDKRIIDPQEAEGLMDEENV
jgi:hypothetical protein